MLDDDDDPDPSAARRAAYENTMAPLAKYWRQPGFEETVVNRWGEVGQKRTDGSWVWHEDPAITPPAIYAILRMLANRAGERFDERDHPLLYTDSGNKRISAVTGTAAAYTLPDDEEADVAPGIAIAVRDIASKPRDLAAWGAHDLQKIEEIVAGTRRINTRFYSERTRDDMLETLRRGGAVLLVGGMGTGKTGLLVSLVPEIPEHYRIVIVEDTREIRVPHRNRIHLRASRSGKALSGLDWVQLLDFVKRATPDVTLCGEVSASNAVILWNLMNIGLSNFMTTVHGNSAAEGIRAIYQQIANVQPELDYRMVTELIETCFSRIIYIEQDKATNKREIREYKLPHQITRSGDVGLDQRSYDKLRRDAQRPKPQDGQPTGPSD
jgi:type IV secretory pathway ATPase VirB11/archaellum biosynthesis ATPase